MCAHGTPEEMDVLRLVIFQTSLHVVQNCGETDANVSAEANRCQTRTYEAQDSPMWAAMARVLLLHLCSVSGAVADIGCNIVVMVGQLRQCQSKILRQQGHDDVKIVLTHSLDVAMALYDLNAVVGHSGIQP